MHQITLLYQNSSHRHPHSVETVGGLIEIGQQEPAALVDGGYFCLSWIVLHVPLLNCHTSSMNDRWMEDEIRQ
jgi:hypothetical protein